jgi:hypothetical protein
MHRSSPGPRSIPISPHPDRERGRPFRPSASTDAMRRRSPIPRIRELARVVPLAALLAAVPAAAQEQIAQAAAAPAGRGSATVAGRVVDAMTGEGISGVSIRLPKLNRAIATGDGGYFLLADLPEGEVDWTFTRMGYATHNEASEVRDGDRFTVALLPRPELLEGLLVTVDALESNRRSVATTVRAVGETELQTSGYVNPLDVLGSSSMQVEIVPCPPKMCVNARGKLIYPIVWIDDEPAPGGLTELAGYPAWDLYTVESFADGKLIRAYTRNYMEQMARNGRTPRRLAPNWGGGTDPIWIEPPPPMARGNKLVPITRPPDGGVEP